MHFFIKKITTLALVLTVFVLSFTGCGKITQETTSLNDYAVSDTTQNTTTLDDKLIVAGIGGLLREYIVTLELDRPTTKTDPANIDSSLFKNSSFTASSTYIYWNYATGKNKIGNLTEEITARYRHYDKRTGQPFEKTEETFNYKDVLNIDYTEREISFSATYPEYPNKKIYQITASEKIVKDVINKDIFSFSLFNNSGTIEYVGVDWDILKVTKRDLIWNNASKKASGTMEVQGSSYPQFKGFFTLDIDQQNGSHYLAELLMDNRKMAAISVCGRSDHAETTYYIGNNVYYQDLDEINEGIEDFSTIEFQDSTKYSQQATIDGTKNLQIGKMLRNLQLTTKDNARPVFNKGIIIKNVENLTIEKISVKTYLTISNCKNVVINGVNYGDIIYRLIKI